MSEVQVITRPYDSKIDEAYVYATWLRGAWHDDNYPDKKKYFYKKTQEIKQLLPSCKIMMACLSNDPWVLFGYIAVRGGKFEWMHLKGENKGFAESGIKELLLKHLGES